MISILLVDDHDLVRQGLRELLQVEDNFSIVAEVATGEAAYTAYFKYQPDIMLLDISLPRESGLSTMRRLLARDQDANILALSMYDDPVIVMRALDNGAKGYISKSASADVLKQAINAVAGGALYLEKRLHEQLHERTTSEINPSQVLTDREFEVFTLLAEGRTVNEIAGVLHLSAKTIGAYHTSIMKKLGLKNSAQLVRMAIAWGLIRL